MDKLDEEIVVKSSEFENMARIADLISNGHSLADIQAIGGNTLAKPIRFLLNNGFSLEEVGQVYQEKILASAIMNYLKTGQNFTPEMLEEYQLPFIEVEEIFIECPHDYNEMIRIDASGVIFQPKVEKLSQPYRNAMNILSKKNLVTSDPKAAKALLKYARKFMEQKGIQCEIVGKDYAPIPKGKIKVTEMHPYKVTDYNLRESKVWRECLGTFKYSFATIEKVLKRGLANRNIDPQVIKSMNVYDFQDLIYRVFPHPDNVSARPFVGSQRKKIMGIMADEKNCEIIKKFLVTKGFNKDYIESTIERMQNGFCNNLFSIHHIEHVKHSGGKFNYNKTNSPSNLVLISSEMHANFVHHRDKVLDNGCFRKLLPNDHYDLLLSYSPIFQVKAPENKKQLDISKLLNKFNNKAR